MSLAVHERLVSIWLRPDKIRGRVDEAVRNEFLQFTRLYAHHALDDARARLVCQQVGVLPLDGEIRPYSLTAEPSVCCGCL
jgi:hypothetical protein